jgi:hypothetical protein
MDMLQSLSKAQKLVLVLSMCIALIGAGKSYHYTQQYTGTDFECRMRGVALMDEGYSAYFYRTHSSRLAFTGVTVPPAVLWLHYSLSYFTYAQAKLLWLIIQYLLLATAIVLLVKVLPVTNYTQLLMAMLIAVYFICSAHWQFHVERGQVYVYYLFLFAATYTLYKKNSPSAVFAAGLLLAFAVWCKVLFIVVAIPLLLQKNRPFISGLMAGLLLFCLLSLPGCRQWLDYFAAVNAYTSGSSTSAAHLPLAVAGQFPSGAALPATFKNDFVTGCINYIGEYLKRLNTSLPRQFYPMALAFLWLLTGALKRRHIARFSTTDSFCFAFLLYISSEYITGGSRNAYNLIQWLFPLLLILPACKPRSLAFQLLIAGAALINAFPLYFPGCFELGELLLFTGTSTWLWGNGKKITITY